MLGADILIVGGGIAGLATAFYLGQTRQLRVCLLEQEAGLASHSSGRNAAIFRPVDDLPSTPGLALRSVELLTALEAPTPLLRPTGILFIAQQVEALDAACRLAAAHGIAVERGESSRWHAGLAGGEAERAAWIPSGGVLDIHALNMALAAHARALGVEIHVTRQVRALCVEGGRVRGVELSDGERLTADRVVLAAGAWNGSLGAACGAPLPLQPVRRHLVQLAWDGGRPAATLPADASVVWRLDDEVYFRPESGGVLGSPCDESSFEACQQPPVHSEALELLAIKLARTAPRLATARVRRAWACLRTFAPDREVVVGPDPRISGLFWFGGLGGRGMSVGVALAERLVGTLLGDGTILPYSMLPERLLR